jgi:hypothetical protein
MPFLLTFILFHRRLPTEPKRRGARLKALLPFALIIVAMLYQGDFVQ